MFLGASSVASTPVAASGGDGGLLSARSTITVRIRGELSRAVPPGVISIKDAGTVVIDVQRSDVSIDVSHSHIWID